MLSGLLEAGLLGGDVTPLLDDRLLHLPGVVLRPEQEVSGELHQEPGRGKDQGWEKLQFMVGQGVKFAELLSDIGLPERREQELVKEQEKCSLHWQVRPDWTHLAQISLGTSTHSSRAASLGGDKLKHLQH